MRRTWSSLLPFCTAIGALSLCAVAQSQAIEWLTTPDRTSLVARQPAELTFEPEREQGSTDLPSIRVDNDVKMQPIDGFGFALTGGSAQLLMRMSAEKRHALLQEMFAPGGDDGVSYLRISIGSSDMNAHVFTYDDVTMGAVDLKLKHFQLGPDLEDVVPVMQEILHINPKLKILATPWSAPSWMKSNEKPKGGSLKPEYYEVYAEYLARYVKSMKARKITIDAITPQNEPLNPHNTPGMVMTAEEEEAFLKQALGPVFRKEHIATKIVLYDHNCDRPDYPMTILADKNAAQYVDGSGFHLYGGTIDAMTQVHEAYPDKNLYFTEQMVVDHVKEGPELQVAHPVSEVVIGAISNWSRNVLLWNLAADPNFGPHTDDGGCPICEGAITLDGDVVTKNVAFYTIVQVSKFVPPGSVHIRSTSSGDQIAQVAFQTPDGKTVLLVANTADAAKTFRVINHGKMAKSTLPAGAVATYVW